MAALVGVLWGTFGCQQTLPIVDDEPATMAGQAGQASAPASDGCKSPAQPKLVFEGNVRHIEVDGDEVFFVDSDVGEPAPQDTLGGGIRSVHADGTQLALLYTARAGESIGATLRASGDLVYFFMRDAAVDARAYWFYTLPRTGGAPTRLPGQDRSFGGGNIFGIDAEYLYVAEGEDLFRVSRQAGVSSRIARLGDVSTNLQLYQDEIWFLLHPVRPDIAHVPKNGSDAVPVVYGKGGQLTSESLSVNAGGVFQGALRREPDGKTTDLSSQLGGSLRISVPYGDKVYLGGGLTFGIPPLIEADPVSFAHRTLACIDVLVDLLRPAEKAVVWLEPSEQGNPTDKDKIWTVPR